MSWHFSRALVEAYSQENFLDGELSVQLKSNPTPQAFLSPARMKAFSVRSLSGMTFAPLTESLGAGLLTWFLEAFPVRILVPSQQQKEKGSMAKKADCGLSLQESFATYNRSSSSWKIHQDLSPTVLIEFSGRWPKWGTMRNGVCSGRPIAEGPTKDREHGLWHGTPRCADAIGASDNWSGKWRNPTSHFRWFLHCQFSQGAPKTFPCPECIEAVMGWPIGWTALRQLETDKFQSWRQQHGVY